MRRTKPRPRVYSKLSAVHWWKMEWPYPFSVSTSLCDSPSTSKILIVLSEEHVANRLP